MKKILLLFAMFSSVLFAGAQNIQLLYNTGENQNNLTSTVEMFRPDKLGNTFFFIDFSYGAGEVEGVSSAYWEIARAFTIAKSPVAFHAEYNGGLGQWKDGEFSGAYSINNAWLTGLEYAINAKDFSKGITFQALYKYIQDKNNVSFQLTTVWYLNAFNSKLSFSGYADFWREDSMFDTTETKYIFMTQPQLWYNFSKNFSIGTEIQFAYNFGGIKGFDVMPSPAVRYTF
ncbi:DUF5020 family protein [Draconibacterium sp.]|jgi:hypothetical protein